MGILTRLTSRLSGAQRIATVLTAGNVLSLLMSLGGTFVLTWLFAIDELGRLGMISSLTMLCAPFITFRLDLAFERLGSGLWTGLVFAVHGLALAAGIAIGGLACVVAKTTGLLTVEDAAYFGLNTFLFCSHSFVWSWLVARRALGLSVLLQVTRALFSFGLPALLLLILPTYHALLLGTTFSQAAGFAFLLGVRNWSIRSAGVALASTWRRQHHLFFANSLPIFLNLLSVQGMQPLTFYVYGPATAGLFWVVMRLVFIPATVFCDPIRRAAYARHPNLKQLTAAILREYALASWIGLLAGIAAAVFLWATSGYWLPSLKPSYHEAVPAIYLAAAWAGTTIGNCPTTGAIPTLRLILLPSFIEILGIAGRGSAILLGLMGVNFQVTFALFFSTMLIINVGAGTLIRSIGRTRISATEG